MKVELTPFQQSQPYPCGAPCLRIVLTSPSSLIPEPRRALYGLNPMAGVVEGFRWTLLGKAEAPGPLLAVSVTVVILLFVGGGPAGGREKTSAANCRKASP